MVPHAHVYYVYVYVGWFIFGTAEPGAEVLTEFLSQLGSRKACAGARIQTRRRSALRVAAAPRTTDIIFIIPTLGYERGPNLPLGRQKGVEEPCSMYLLYQWQPAPGIHGVS